MKIYHIEFENGGYALNAVVIAESAAQAVGVLPGLRLDELKCVHEIGVCTDGTTEARRVCEESL